VPTFQELIWDFSPKLRAAFLALPGSGASLDVALAVDYTNATAVASDVVTGAIVTTGRPLLVEAWGNVAVANNESNANPTLLVEDTAVGVFQLFVGGVGQNHARADFQGPLSLIGGAWQFGGTGHVDIFALVTGLAAGSHTLAVKANLAAVPASGASVVCPALSGPAVFGFRMRAVEV
jgi:hypothetical protein